MLLFLLIVAFILLIVYLCYRSSKYESFTQSDYITFDDTFTLDMQAMQLQQSTVQTPDVTYDIRLGPVTCDSDNAQDVKSGYCNGGSCAGNTCSDSASSSDPSCGAHGPSNTLSLSYCIDYSGAMQCSGVVCNAGSANGNTYLGSYYFKPDTSKDTETATDWNFQFKFEYAGFQNLDDTWLSSTPNSSSPSNSDGKTLYYGDYVFIKTLSNNQYISLPDNPCDSNMCNGDYPSSNPMSPLVFKDLNNGDSCTGSSGSTTGWVANNCSMFRIYPSLNVTTQNYNSAYVIPDSYYGQPVKNGDKISIGSGSTYNNGSGNYWSGSFLYYDTCDGAQTGINYNCTTNQSICAVPSAQSLGGSGNSGDEFAPYSMCTRGYAWCLPSSTSCQVPKITNELTITRRVSYPTSKLVYGSVIQLSPHVPVDQVLATMTYTNDGCTTTSDDCASATNCSSLDSYTYCGVSTASCTNGLSTVGLVANTCTSKDTKFVLELLSKSGGSTDYTTVGNDDVVLIRAMGPSKTYLKKYYVEFDTSSTCPLLTVNEYDWTETPTYGWIINSPYSDDPTTADKINLVWQNGNYGIVTTGPLSDGSYVVTGCSNSSTSFVSLSQTPNTENSLLYQKRLKIGNPGFHLGVVTLDNNGNCVSGISSCNTTSNCNSAPSGGYAIGTYRTTCQFNSVTDFVYVPNAQQYIGMNTMTYGDAVYIAPLWGPIQNLGMYLSVNSNGSVILSNTVPTSFQIGPVNKSGSGLKENEAYTLMYNGGYLGVNSDGWLIWSTDTYYFLSSQSVYQSPECTNIGCSPLCYEEQCCNRVSKEDTRVYTGASYDDNGKPEWTVATQGIPGYGYLMSCNTGSNTACNTTCPDGYTSTGETVGYNYGDTNSDPHNAYIPVNQSTNYGNYYFGALNYAPASLVCERDWSKVMDNELSQVNCCSLASTSADDCDPSYCPNNTWTCKDIMVDKCGLNFNNWKSGGQYESQCDKYLATAPPEDASELIATAASSYFSSFTPVQAANNGDTFMNKLISMCNMYPGTCDDILRQTCNGLTSSDLDPNNYPDNNPAVMQVCGCFLEPSQYNLPSVCAKLPNSQKIACNTMCNFPNSVKPLNPATGELETCNTTECVIEDVTFNVINSTMGGINIDTVCTGCGTTKSPCGENGCNCFFSNIVINEIGDSVPLKIDGVCGNCYIYNEDDPSETYQIPCSQLGIVTPNYGGTEGGDTGGDTSGASSTRNWTMILLIAGIVIGLGLLLIAYILSRSK